MLNLDTTKARDEFADTLNRVAYGKEHIILQRRGKDLAAVIPIEDYHLLENYLASREDEMDVEEARKILSDPNEDRIPFEQIKKEILG
jgi:prevent-host-death family protein